jgi:Tol biopolymer transport system component
MHAQSTGPEARKSTDPKAIISEVKSGLRQVPIEDLFFVRSLDGASWSVDGKEIFLSMDLSGRKNLWKVPASGGWPIQLTQNQERQFAFDRSPDGKWLIYQQDQGGNEVWDLYAVPVQGGESVNLTKTPEAREDGTWTS